MFKYFIVSTNNTNLQQLQSTEASSLNRDLNLWNAQLYESKKVRSTSMQAAGTKEKFAGS